MIFKRHRVGDELKAIVQTAVRLNVQIFCVRVGNIQQLLGVIAVCAAAVNFELNAEMTQTFAVENKVWCVAVFVDDLVVLVLTG